MQQPLSEQRPEAEAEVVGRVLPAGEVEVVVPAHLAVAGVAGAVGAVRALQVAGVGAAEEGVDLYNINAFVSGPARRV